MEKPKPTLLPIEIPDLNSQGMFIDTSFFGNEGLRDIINYQIDSQNSDLYYTQSSKNSLRLIGISGENKKRAKNDEMYRKKVIRKTLHDIRRSNLVMIVGYGTEYVNS